MKIAIGIPHLVSAHDSALRLCLLSLERYAGFEYDVFLLLDEHEPEMAREFDLERILRRHPRIRTKRYKSRDNGHCKQAIVNWVMEHEEYDAAFFLHTDVFLYRDGLLPAMLRTVTEGGNLACFWTVPLCEVHRHFAREELMRQTVLVAPRFSTWLFCLDCARYRELAKRFSFTQGLFRGHQARSLKEHRHPLVKWLRSQPEFPIIGEGYEYIFCDIGTYFRYVTEKLGIPCHSMGITKHPDFSSMELERHPDGYVHIEQFTPVRFRQEYTPELFAKRERMVLDVLAEEYGVTD